MKRPTRLTKKHKTPVRETGRAGLTSDFLSRLLTRVTSDWLSRLSVPFRRLSRKINHYTDRTSVWQPLSFTGLKRNRIAHLIVELTDERELSLNFFRCRTDNDLQDHGVSRVLDLDDPLDVERASLWLKNQMLWWLYDRGLIEVGEGLRPERPMRRRT